MHTQCVQPSFGMMFRFTLFCWFTLLWYTLFGITAVALTPNIKVGAILCQDVLPMATSCGVEVLLGRCLYLHARSPIAKFLYVFDYSFIGRFQQ